MKAKMILVAALAVALAGCAAPVALKKQTASGKPEGEYKNTTVAKVKSALLTRCNEKGLMTASTESDVTCSKTVEGGSGILAQALIGNSYSTPPVARVKYSISQIDSDVKVWADMWIETQMAMGQVNTMPITDNGSKNNIQTALDSLKIN